MEADWCEAELVMGPRLVEADWCEAEMAMGPRRPRTSQVQVVVAAAEVARPRTPQMVVAAVEVAAAANLAADAAALVPRPTSVDLSCPS